MIVGVVYNEPDKGRPDSMDVLLQVKTVKRALRDLGHDFVPIPITNGSPGKRGPLNDLLEGIEKDSFDILFNLVEGLGDDSHFIAPVAGAFELLGVPYTGASFEALAVTTNKNLSKIIMKSQGIMTPPWVMLDPESGFYCSGSLPPFPLIVKPACEDGSIGIDDSSLICCEEDLAHKISSLLRVKEKKRYMAESFVDGRELSISLWESGGKPSVLPVAEMEFRDWPEGKPRILSYDAKWTTSSYEYGRTVRRYHPDNVDLDSLSSLAIHCWEIFALCGYARIDLRLDQKGSPCVIEVNANPCLSPDGGFMAAAQEYGLSASEVIEKILGAGLHRVRKRAGSRSCSA